MRPRRQDCLDEFRCGRAGLLRPLDDPRRSPIQMLLMSFRHVLGNSGIASFFEAALMSHNALGIKEDLHSIDSDKGLYFLAAKLVGNAVSSSEEKKTYLSAVLWVSARPSSPMPSLTAPAEGDTRSSCSGQARCSKSYCKAEPTT